MKALNYQPLAHSALTLVMLVLMMMMRRKRRRRVVLIIICRLYKRL